MSLALCLAPVLLAGCVQRPPPAFSPPIAEPQALPPAEEPDAPEMAPASSAYVPGIRPKAARTKPSADRPPPVIRPRDIDPVQAAPLTDPTTY